MRAGCNLLYLLREVVVDAETNSQDDSGRRAFKPPRQRAPRRQMRPPTLNLWRFRHGFGLGIVRATCAIGFGFVPAVSDQFGDAALALVSVALAAVVAGIVVSLIRMSRRLEWPLLADAATLFILVPILVTASGIEVADSRFGGRGVNFFAAAMAVVLLYVIVVTIATRGWSQRGSAGQLGALPGAFSITVVLLGTANFSAGGIWRGLSIAWMSAALVTVTAMMIPARYRPVVAPLAFALFAAGVVFTNTASDETASLSSGSSAIAALSAMIVAAVLILIPGSRPVRETEPPPD